MPDACLFCRIVAREIPAAIVAESTWDTKPTVLIDASDGSPLSAAIVLMGSVLPLVKSKIPSGGLSARA